MRKPILSRIFLFTVLYIGVFSFLAAIQFSRPVEQSLIFEHFMISGQYHPADDSRQDDDSREADEFGEYLIDGGISVFFGGMEFCLAKLDDGRSLYVTGADNLKTVMFPERMIVSGDCVRFIFPGESELVFSIRDASEMRIYGLYPDDFNLIEIPFKLQRRTGITNAGNGQFIVSSGNINYTFGHSPIDPERRVLHIIPGRTYVSYRAIGEKGIFSPEDFILSEAETPEAYTQALTRWRNENFPLWFRNVSELNNEDIVIALAGEAAQRGNYRAALAAVPQTFLQGNARSFESSVFLGGMTQAQRSLLMADQEKQNRLSRMINERSLEFLFEKNVFQFFAIRGNYNLINAALDLIAVIDTATLALDLVPGILEGFSDWKVLYPNRDNPFESLAKEACHVVSESLRRTYTAEGGRVFVPHDSGSEIEFNLRLGKALLEYAGASDMEEAASDSWAGISRSLILSALFHSGENPDLAAQTGAGLYRILNPVNIYPRAVSLLSQPNNVWAWTAVSSIRADQPNNDTLDIDVSFVSGESHYMIIRGIRPFVRLQLHGIDYRSDPQFERYDSSGWIYSSQDQTLVVKMRHRSPVERLRIIFAEAPRPVPPAPANQPALPPVVIPAPLQQAPRPIVVPAPVQEVPRPIVVPAPVQEVPRPVVVPAPVQETPWQDLVPPPVQEAPRPVVVPAPGEETPRPVVTPPVIVPEPTAPPVFVPAPTNPIIPVHPRFSQDESYGP